MITIMIVDDHDLISNAIAALLSDAPDMTVIAKAKTGEEAILLAKQHKPNVILMDIQLPGISGIAAAEKIMAKDPDIKIIALSSHAEEPFVINILKAGAQGYLTKGTSAEKMIEAIRMVASGKKVIAPHIAQKLALKNTANTTPLVFETLSTREFNIVMMLSQGLSPKAIAEKLFISVKTLNGHRCKIHEKLNIKTDVELILLTKQIELV